MLQDIYSIFDHFGINPTTVIIALALFSFLWILAAREIFSWLMKTNEISKQFKLLHQRLDQMEHKILVQTSGQASNQTPQPKVAPIAQPAKNLFEIHH